MDASIFNLVLFDSFALMKLYISVIQEKPDKHWPNVISIISERFSGTDHPVYDKALYFCDEVCAKTMSL